jgi:glutaredoxin
MMNEAIRIEIYSRPGCHLCDEAKSVIESVQDRHRLEVHVINIEDDPELEARYGTEIPVVFINGRKSFKYRVDSHELERRLKRLWNP